MKPFRLPSSTASGFVLWKVGAVVLDRLIGVQHVAAYLVAPFRGWPFPAQFGRFPGLFFVLQGQEPRLENPHGELPVLVLGALVLATDYYSRGQVGQPNC